MSSYARLISRIKKFETETFSAKKVGLTSDEAEKVADLLISRWTELSLDGVGLVSALALIREKQ
jgi:hypothetical protein